VCVPEHCEIVTSQYPAHGQGISLSAQGASMATKSSHINRRAKRTINAKDDELCEAVPAAVTFRRKVNVR
jgi:hypothetical protein